jgi:hypothetical protein
LSSPFSSIINDIFVPCQLLHYSQNQSGSFPVSLLHIELSGSTSGDTKIDASEIPRSILSLSPTRRGEGQVNSTPVDNAAAGSHRPTSSVSFSADVQSTTSHINRAADRSLSAFSMDSLKASLESVETLSHEQANLRDRVNQLEGRVVVCEEDLNQIKLTFASHADEVEQVKFDTFCSETALKSLKELVKNCGESNSYFRAKISRLEESIQDINKINEEASVRVQNTIYSLGNGTDLSPFLLELKNMQANYSIMQAQLNTCFAEKDLREFGSKQGKYTMPILYSIPHLCCSKYSLSRCRTMDSRTAF